MGIFGSEKKEHNDESDTESQEVVNQENFNFNDVLICSTHGKVYAIHKRNGDRLWRAEFPSGRLTGGGVLSLFVTDYDKLIVGGNGRTVCLNIMTGDTLWVNKMEVLIKVKI
jgi:outer membrane protein assembly factor BamB